MLPDFHEFEEYVATHDVFTPPSAHIYNVDGLTPENAQAFFESVYPYRANYPKLMRFPCE